MTNEKRLIDANSLIAEYDRVHIGEPGKARKLMEDAPTVDAVDVVRCKDCRHIEYVEGGIPYCAWHSRGCGNSEFCSYGERKRYV